MSPSRIALGYAVIAILWIAFSDRVVTHFGLNPLMMTIKGIVFVLVTAALLHVTISRLVQAFQRTSEELRESEALLTEAQKLTHTGSWRLDLVHNRLFWSDEVFRLFGVLAGTPLTYDSFLAAVHPDDRSMVDDAWKKALLGANYDLEHRIVVDGEVRWVRETARLEFDADGKATNGIGTVQDITERTRAEAALREQAALLSLTHDTVFVMDMEGVIRYWNGGAEERYGWNWEQAVGRVVHDLLKTVFPTSLNEIKSEVTRNGRWEGELLHTRKDGTQVLVASRWALQRNQHGAPVAILETNNDITERKRAEQALRRLNRELRAISSCNQTLLRATDEQHLLEEICRIVCEEAGYRPVWVSYVEHDERKSVRPVAWAGTTKAYLENAKITWAESDAHGNGPTGNAIRSGNTCCIDDFATDPRVAPWREILLSDGFRSAVALPLKDEHANVFGTLTMHSDRAHAFTADEVRLLDELAGDLAFGIVTLRSQAARKEAEDHVTLLSFALDHVREAAILIDASARLRYVNDEGCRLYGYTRAEMLGKSIPDIDPEFPVERWPDHWRALKEQRRLSFESQRRTRDGQVFPIEVSANYFEYRGHAYNLALVRDITDRKRIEEERRQNAERFRAIADYTFDWENWIGVDGKLLWVNPAVERITGYTVDECMAMPDFPVPIVAESDRQAVASQMREAVEGSSRNDFEFRVRRKDGRLAWVAASWQPIRDSRGARLGYRSSMRDIEERKRAEEALRRSEAYLAEAQRLTHAGSWAWDTASKTWIYWSDEMFRIFQFDPQAPLPTRQMLFSRILADDRTRVEDNFDRSAREGVDTLDEYRIALPDGTLRIIQINRHPVLNEAGEIRELMGTAMDITERKRVEDELRESETRFRTFVDHAGDALFVQDLEHGTIVDVNQPACDGLGFTREELIGNTPHSYHVDSDPGAMESAEQRAAAGDTVSDRHWHRRKNGSRFPVEVNTSSFSYGGRRFLLKVARDISDRVRAEEQRERLRQVEADLAHVNRVSMLGELAASVAHELKQPIAAAALNAAACLQWLQGARPNLSGAGAAAGRILEDANRADDIIDRLRSLYRKSAPKRELVDVNQTIHEMVALLLPEASRHGVSIHSELPEKLPQIMADRVQLQQVLMNLMLNAIEAMHGTGGVLTLRPQLARENNDIEISVSDTGIGLPAGKADHIFDAFFTTKAQGSGMGLSISRSIIESHGGRIWAESNDGQGTTFHFVLPIAAVASASAAASGPGAPERRPQRDTPPSFTKNGGSA